MTNLLLGKEKASDAVIMNNEAVQSDRVPMRELREVSQMQEKPSPKLQPHNVHTHDIRIQQPK